MILIFVAIHQTCFHQRDKCLLDDRQLTHTLFLRLLNHHRYVLFQSKIYPNQVHESLCHLNRMLQNQVHTDPWWLSISSFTCEIISIFLVISHKLSFSSNLIQCFLNCSLDDSNQVRDTDWMMKKQDDNQSGQMYIRLYHLILYYTQSHRTHEF